MRGEATLSGLSIAWEVPDAFPESAGGLPYLPAAGGGSARARWAVREGTPGPLPERYDAFYGPVRLALDPGEVRVHGPDAELVVGPAGVDGVVSGHAALAASIALHAVAAWAGLAHVHAALVSIDGVRVLAPGGSGAGKTSLALAIARAGGELLSDDLVYVGRDLVAWPVRRPPHVMAATLAAHPELTVLGPVVDGALPKMRVGVPSARPATPTAVDVLVLPTLAPEGPTRVVPIEGVEAFPVLVGASALAVVEGTPRRDEILDVLAALAERPLARLVAGTDALRDPSVIAREIRLWLETRA